MKNIFILVLGFVIAGFFLRGCFIGPESQIRKQLSDLEELVSFGPGESDLAAVAKVKRLGDLFSEDVRIELTGFSMSRKVEGRSQVRQAALAARSHLGDLEAELHDITVELAEDGQSATVEATGRAQASSESSSLVKDFRMRLEKIEGVWLIAEVSSVEALR